MAAKKRTKKKKAASKVRKARIPKTWAEMARMMDRVGKKFDTIPKSKKRGGLSGSPAHHESEAKKAAKSAVDFFRRAGKFARNGDCFPAMSAFAMGAVEEGKTIAHQAESHQLLSVSESGAVVDGYNSAELAIRSKCIIGEGGLSGMRRRRRRR